MAAIAQRRLSAQVLCKRISANNPLIATIAEVIVCCPEIRLICNSSKSWGLWVNPRAVQ